jgi:cell division transport system ATP-binding protein
MLSVQNLYKTYPGPNHAIANVTFEIQPGEMTYLIGHSGAGKTTLFNLINGFDRPSSGSIRLDEYNLDNLSHSESLKIRQNIGVIFQDFRLLHHKSLLDNILIPLVIRNVNRKVALDMALKLAEELNLSSVIYKLPTEVSGGEQQRTAIARAIIHDPKFIFADEPTGSLDPENGKNIFRILHHLATQGKVVLVATHNHELMSDYPGKVLRLSKGRLIC